MVIGFGGSCHWCTEAIFQSLKGVSRVEQGWISSQSPYSSYSEAVRVHFDPEVIVLETLVQVHLYTHSCTSDHGMREKYRSAVYTLTDEQQQSVRTTLENVQAEFDAPITTQILPLTSFKLNEKQYLDYYYNNPDKPFCEYVIHPKLQIILKHFKKNVDLNKLKIK